MRFPSPLQPARLVRRYKRFLADCTLADGTEITAHVANPGAMTGLADPGARVWLRHSPDPRRKLAWSWQIAEPAPGVFVGVDTGAANRILRPVFEGGTAPGLTGYATCRAEVRYDENSRVDFLLSGPGRADTYVEVKAVTLSRAPGLAEFPDTRTARGAKHLEALARVARSGARAVMVYLVLRSDAGRMALAADIDPAYAAASRAAADAGVEMLAYAADLTPERVAFSGKTLPIVAAEGAPAATPRRGAGKDGTSTLS